MDVYIPLLMANLVDNAIILGDMSEVGRIGIILIAAVFFATIGGVASGHFATIASAGLAKNVRKDIFSKIQTFSFENIDKFSTGSLITRLTTDVQNIQMASQMTIRMAIRSPFMLIFASTMAFRISPVLFKYFFFTIPILIVGLYLILKNARSLFHIIFNLYDKLNTRISENLLGIRVVKGFVREEEETEKFEKLTESIYKKYTQVMRLKFCTFPMMNLAMYTSMILISWFGAKFIVAGDLTTGVLISLNTYTMQILINLMMLSIILVQISNSRTSADRIEEVLNEKPTRTSPVDGKDYVNSGDIVFENVSFSYANDEEKLNLKDVNLSISSGMSIGIMGTIGSSKSTLVQLIPRLYDVTKGRILVDGTDVKDYDLKTLRDSVAMVLQKNTLFTGTVRSNLKFGDLNASDEKIIKYAKIACAHEFIMESPKGYDTEVERGGVNFSGGQRQRLTIARALLKEPKILILDDSTSALDNGTERQIMNNLATELPSMTKIIISQKISSIENCDLILVMDEGEIVNMGRHSELIVESEIYRDIYQTQKRGNENV